jgi:broad specificity phosphatase PhoE
VAARLVLVAHGATAGMRELVFGDRTDLLHPELVEPWHPRVASWSRGPEPACLTTAVRLGGDAEVVADLAGPDLGRWTGRTLAEVAADEPDGLGEWMSDPDASPHGGESLAQLVQRVGRHCDGRSWPDGSNVAVVAPLVARAAAVHALAVAPEALFRVDVAPLGRVGLSKQGTSWRLQRLG